MQPSTDVRAERGELLKCRHEQRFDAALPRGGRPGRDLRESLWSALQTHLQGVDRTALAIVPEKCRHRAALPISIRYRANVAGASREGKPASRRATMCWGDGVDRDQALSLRTVSPGAALRPTSPA